MKCLGWSKHMEECVVVNDMGICERYNTFIEDGLMQLVPQKQ